MLEFKDYYEVLRVGVHASVDEIRQAYRNLARQAHPDLAPDNPQIAARYQDLLEAQTVLTDSARRNKYDQLWSNWQIHQKSSPDELFDWEDWLAVPFSDLPEHGEYSRFYRAIFAGLKVANAKIIAEERDLDDDGPLIIDAQPIRRTSAEPTLVERPTSDPVAQSVEPSVSEPTLPDPFDEPSDLTEPEEKVTSDADHSLTEREYPEPTENSDLVAKLVQNNVADDEEGDQTDGELIEETEEEPPAEPEPPKEFVHPVTITLEECIQGTSRIVKIGDQTLQVRVPRGARNGTRIRLRGRDGRGVIGEERHELTLEIVLASHELFTPEEDDLHTEVTVDLYTAILGGQVTVPTLTNNRLKLKIPPETQPGRVFRLKGLGLPKIHQPDENGDLHLKIIVSLPENLSAEELALFEELADIRGL